MTLPPALLAAWHATEYRVTVGDTELVMHIDQPCRRLAALLHEARVGCAAWITADNPGSTVQGEADNATARIKLRQAVEQTGWPWLAARSVDPSCQHPDERALFILGITPGEACKLGRRFGQDGIVLVAADGVPRLLILHEDAGPVTPDER